jgi:hypothetical protein
MIYRITAVLALALCIAATAASCTREDGLPDPPIQQLVPCDPSAAPDSPLACPALLDAGTAD